MSLNAISGLFSRQRARLGIPSSLSSGITCKFQCGDCNATSYGKSKHLGISAFTEKIVKVDVEDYHLSLKIIFFSAISCLILSNSLFQLLTAATLLLP